LLVLPSVLPFLGLSMGMNRTREVEGATDRTVTEKETDRLQELALEQNSSYQSLP
jgi:hypothetical protein